MPEGKQTLTYRSFKMLFKVALRWFRFVFRIQSVSYVLCGTHQHWAEPLLQLLLWRQGQFRSRRLFEAAKAGRVLGPFHFSAGWHLHAAWSVPHGSLNHLCTLYWDEDAGSVKLVHIWEPRRTMMSSPEVQVMNCCGLLILYRASSFSRHLNLE